jgi:predicted dehydrogenase
VTQAVRAIHRSERDPQYANAGSPMYRVGIIGFGRVGQRRAKLVDAHPQLELVAVADPHIQDAAALASSCAWHPSGADLLRQNLDAVFVCTPNAVTADLVVQALEAGKHVFAEKPPGRSIADIERIRDIEARSAGLTVKVGFNHREHESVRLSQSLIASGELGRVMWMRGTYGKAGGPGYEGDWRADPAIAGGGILLDQGIHMLDLFRLFGGEFTEVKSFVGETFWRVGLEDNAFALLRGENGLVAMLHSSATHWNHTFRLEIYLTEGYLVLDGFLTGSQTYGRETLVFGRRDWNDSDSARGRPREERYYFDDDRSWEREVDDFVRCMSTGSKVINGSSLDAHRAMDLVSRVYAADGWRGRR